MNELDLLSPAMFGELHRIRDSAIANEVTDMSLIEEVTRKQSAYVDNKGQVTIADSRSSVLAVCLTIEMGRRHLSVSLPVLGTRPSRELLQRIMDETGFRTSLDQATIIPGITVPAMHVYETVPVIH